MESDLSLRVLKFVPLYYFKINIVRPRLSEQAELNLRMGRSVMPKIRIIEDDLFTEFITKNHHQNG